MPQRLRRLSRVSLALAAASLALAAAAAAGVSEWRSVLGERPQAAAAQRVIVVLTAPSLADRVAGAVAKPAAADERRWTRDALGAQQILFSLLRRRGVRIEVEYRFTRTLNGFSAALGPRALAEVERAPGVLGVYPVRTVYPASLSADVLSEPEFGEQSGRRPALSLGRRDGSGVTVAILDTGFDLGHPYLRGRFLPGWDTVGRDDRPDAAAKPGEPGLLEAHGTRVAGLVAGSGGPAGLHGVAPGAHLLPIRVLGWQRTDGGSFALFGRGDQLIAGLERAVDPDGDGSAEDAARIALAAVVEPYAAFADSPEARAVAGAARLGTLVVAAAGNDGPAGAGFGSIGAPGGAPAALTVGAADLRREVLEAPAVIEAGSQTLLDGPLRVLGAVGPASVLRLRLVPIAGPTKGDPERLPAAVASGTEAADFVDPSGRSLVSGAAALVPADARPLAVKARNAAAAGAAALLVYGTLLPSGGLDLDESAPIPVLAVPAPVGRAAVAAAARGEELSVSLQPALRAASPRLGYVASFSSRGLAFDGGVKPDLVAAGVSLATADAGAGADGAPRYATVTGTSAAAAVAAGAAALVAQARPKLDAAGLKSVLVGGARPLAGEPVTAQGAGLVDPAAAASALVAAEPAVLALGRSDGGAWRAIRVVTVRNLSVRKLRLSLEVEAGPGAARVLLRTRPARLVLPPGGSRAVEIVARAVRGTAGLAAGALVLRAGGAVLARVPWAVSLGSAGRGALVGDVVLSPGRPALLFFAAGRIEPGPSGEAVEPVGVLDLELWRAGKNLGAVARLRDLLPGRYVVGLLGRAPDGRALEPGRYVVRLRARAVDGGPAAESLAQAIFTIAPPTKEKP